MELAIAQKEVGLGDPTMQREESLRARYREVLKAGEQFLRPYRGGLASSARGEVDKIDADRARLVDATAGLTTYFQDLARAVNVKTEDLRKEVRAEYSLLSMHRKSLEELVDSDGAGILAYLNFVRVHKDFRNVVLRGDVGLIDVMWKKKEKMSNKISQLFEDRSAELRALQESFEEVR